MVIKLSKYYSVGTTLLSSIRFILTVCWWFELYLREINLFRCPLLQLIEKNTLNQN